MDAGKFSLEEHQKERAAKQKAEYKALQDEGIERPWVKPSTEREEVERALAEARIAERTSSQASEEV
jgi:hypothetical protein